MKTFKLSKAVHAHCAALTAASGPLKSDRPLAEAAASARRRGVYAVALFWLAAGMFAFSSCTAPSFMRARLQSQPNAAAYADLGAWFGDRKEFRCAAEAFANASRLQPQSEAFAYMWGLSLYSAGDLQGAIKPLRLAERLNPTDEHPHLILGATLDKRGLIPDAEKEWRSALAVDPASSTALDGLSGDLVRAKNYAAAIALLDAPANRGHHSSQQSLNLGMAYARTVQLEKASDVLRTALNSAPDFLPIAKELAVVLVLLTRNDDAIAVLDLALLKHPDDVDTQLLYLRALVSAHSDKAGAVGRRLLSAAPHNWEALYLNGLLETQDGKLEQARAHLEESIAINPNFAKSHQKLGLVFAQLQETPQAIEQLEQAIALGDREPEAQFELAMILRNSGHAEQAKQHLNLFRQLQKARTDQVQAADQATLGDQALAAGDLAQAVTSYRKAIDSNPRDAALAYKLAIAFDKSHDTADELAALEQAIHLNPNLAEAQTQMGFLAMRSGDTSKAEIYFRAAAHASPSDAVAWVNLAALLASEAKWQDASDAVRHALQIDPANEKARQLSQAIAEAAPKP